MSSKTRWILVAAALAAGAGTAAARERLNVELSAAQPVVQGDAEVPLTVTVRNTSAQAVRVLKWQLPSDGIQGPLLRVTREDGRAAPYIGALVKRAEPRARDYVTLQPGDALTYTMDLARQYALDDGRYTVEYVGGSAHAKGAAFRSGSVNVWTAGRTPAAESLAHQAPAPQTESALSYSGACTSSQQSTLSSAFSAATTYATNATTYLSGTPSATQRYVKWFGSYTSTRWNTAKSHFSAIKTAFTTKSVVLDCSCTDTGTYAYVYPTQPYKIYVCGAFWSAPLTGTDSKGGTLVHEMSHFNVVAATDDWAYGQTAAANLAKSNPTKALDNADSHEYFAENNPSLP